jgi:hypothetical protein
LFGKGKKGTIELKEKKKKKRRNKMWNSEYNSM